MGKKGRRKRGRQGRSYSYRESLFSPYWAERVFLFGGGGDKEGHLPIFFTRTLHYKNILIFHC